MKKIEITCDYCYMSIRPNVLYATIKTPLLAEMQFCGICCLDDWIREKYLNNKVEK